MRYFKLLSIGLALLFVFGFADAGSLVVIGNPDIQLSQLTKKQLANIYLGKPASLHTKHTLHPYDQYSSSATYKAFYNSILGWSPSQVSSYWSAEIFSGNASQPGTVGSDSMAIATVESVPYSIAYVDSDSLKGLQGKVKVLYGKTPASFSSKTTKSTNKKSTTTLQSGYHSMYQKPTLVLPKPGSAATAATESSDSGFHSAASSSTGALWGIIQSQIHVGRAVNHRLVRHWLMWYLSHPKDFDKMLQNATPYIYYTYEQTKLRHMPVMFALLPFIESDYNPYAYSVAGATGLWQMMPGTASSYGLNINWWYDARRDILTSTTAALNYLVRLHSNMHSWYLAAAAYNAGQGAVDASIDYNRRRGRATDYWALPLYRQTRNYVPKLLAVAYIIKHAAKYHIKLPNVQDKPYFVAFRMDTQLDLAEIAHLSGASEAEIKRLNPWMRRWATPMGKYTLLIPVDHANEFKRNIDRIAGHRHISWQFHEVHHNETLYSIAHNYHTSEALLKKVNGLRNDDVQPGEGILVPLWLNHTYKKPLGIVNQHSMSLSVKNTIAHVQKTQPKVQQPASTALPSNITAADILSGKLPSKVSSSTEQKQASSATDSAKLKAAEQSLLNELRHSQPQPEKRQQPISSHDSLKTLISKIYGND